LCPVQVSAFRLYLAKEMTISELFQKDFELLGANLLNFLISEYEVFWNGTKKMPFLKFNFIALNLTSF
jgi:hypothetical protein